MLVTLLGIITLVSTLQAENAKGPMLVTAEPISTSLGYLIQDGGALVPLPSGISPAATSAGQSITPSIRYSPSDPSMNVIFV